MGLFTKKIGPVFFKESTSTEAYINALEELKARAAEPIKKEIEDKISWAKYGLIGEERVAYELKASRIDMYILHDVYLELEHENLSSQIDYIVITQNHIYIIECKNLKDNLEVNEFGDFIRNYKDKESERIYSPIEQNERHLRIIKELYETKLRSSILKRIFESSFDKRCKSLIVLANHKAVLDVSKAKKEIKEQIVYIDQLGRKIREMDAASDQTISPREMLKLAEFFQSQHREGKSYRKVYDKLAARVDAQNNELEKLKEEQYQRLIAKLQAFRLEQSKSENIKPYLIFTNAQMEELLNKNPTNKEELIKVSGFGEVKTLKYGEAILEILRSD